MTDAATTTKPKRTCYTHTLPAALLPGGQSRTVGIVPLTRRQEALLMDRAAGKAGAVPGLYVEMSIAQIDGVPVDPSTSDVDRFLDDIGPQARSLLQRAVLRIHTVSEEEADSFFAAVTVSEI